MFYRICFIFVLLFPWLIAFSQDSSLSSKDAICPQKDLPQVLREWMSKPPKANSRKQGTLILVPAIGSNPANGFLFGVAAQYAFKVKDSGCLYSLMSAAVTFTTQNQIIVQVKNNIYTRNNRVFFSGDWRFLKYSQATYGLSTKAPEGGLLDFQFILNGIPTTSDSLIQPMKFNHIRLHQTASLKLRESFYAGFGYHLDFHYKIVDEKLDTVRPLITSHYAYSKLYDFDPSKYLLSGLSVNLVADTRDNMINPYKGFFANLNYRIYPTFFGNEKTASALLLEWRSFHGLSITQPRHLIAFWLNAAFSSKGELPYLDLPSLGYDQRGKTGRGYTQGRYRGPNMIYAEAEYRFPISPCGGVLGGVLFLNATTADQPDGSVKLFNYIAPGYGLGFRVMLDKRSRTNLQVDIGFGKQSTGFYLGASETF